MNRSRDHCRKPRPRALKSSCIVLTDFQARSKLEYDSQPAKRSSSSRDCDDDDSRRDDHLVEDARAAPTRSAPGRGSYSARSAAPWSGQLIFRLQLRKRSSSGERWVSQRYSASSQR